MQLVQAQMPETLLAKKKLLVQQWQQMVQLVQAAAAELVLLAQPAQRVLPVPPVQLEQPVLLVRKVLLVQQRWSLSSKAIIHRCQN